MGDEKDPIGDFLSQIGRSVAILSQADAVLDGSIFGIVPESEPIEAAEQARTRKNVTPKNIDIADQDRDSKDHG